VKLTLTPLRLLLTGIGIIIFSSCGRSDKKSSADGSGGPQRGGGQGGQQPAMAVDIFIIKPMLINEKIEVSGSLEANETTEIHPEISGRLVQLNIAEGKFVTSSENEYLDIQARIRARGADVVENPDKRPPEIIINQNAYGVQPMTLDIDRLNAAVDGSSAATDEKAEAKSLLRRLNENKLLTNLLQKWFAGHLPR